ncbi:MAG: zinc-dependent metalloprotease [Bacteroidota bacterium]
MRLILASVFVFFFSFGFAEPLPTIESKTEGMQAFEGYFPFYWEESTGKIWLEINRWDTEFLYVNSLAAGVGSNDIGLDRGQLGRERVVFFERIGPKVLMVQPNYDYRAVSQNEMERRSVAEAFARSVLAGFSVEAETEGRVLVDMTNFLMRDAHNVIGSLRRNGQGNYNLDANRSAVYLPRTKNFPQNSEFEALLTFQGNPEGRYIRSVVPSPEAITVRQHHSFVQLPDANYQPRVFDPRSGYISISYQDYATPIDQSLTKRFITRHRLEKKNPKARVSEAVEPIVYYLDPGAPEPVKSALLEGARWWNQAFEAAGFKDAFQVKVLPEDADPLDVRYNVIQWVHRSTRGWSYGGSVIDPRTGEIIKGHVSLGSLRVRQDFLIAQGLIGPYESGKKPSAKMLEMALARLRQLSAHEVGHTIGLVHNYAASVNDRASVMDYPHPYITLDDNGKMDFSEAYDVGIGDWDKRAIIYGYQDFPSGTDESEALQEIIQETIEAGLLFITDYDARARGGAHPIAHLWDNGKTPHEELNRVLALRKKALENFGEHMIPEGMPMAMLEDVLVPVYFAHRYQVEAAVKVVGGVRYTYAVRGDGQTPIEMIPKVEQEAALRSILATIEPASLAIPEHILEIIPPRPPGFWRGREHFKPATGFTIDPIAAAEANLDHSLGLLLNPQRMARLVEFEARVEASLTLRNVLNALSTKAWEKKAESLMDESLRQVVQKSLIQHLIQLAANPASTEQVKAEARQELKQIRIRLDFVGEPLLNLPSAQLAHRNYCQFMISEFFAHPERVKLTPAPKMPDGSPIGCY